MKKQFIIKVDIDTDKEGESRSGGPHIDKGVWLVDIRKDKNAPAWFRNDSVREKSAIPILCHELGHCVAQALGLEAANNDTRTNHGTPMLLSQIFGLTEEQQKNKVEAEKEAWELAQTMFDKVKEAAITSYEAMG